MDRDRRYVGGTADMGGDEYFGPYNVTQDQFYPTIQAAVDDADTGDGNRDIDFGGKALTLRSEDPNARDVVEATVINCQGRFDEPHRGFHFHSSEDSNSSVKGLTVQYAYGHFDDEHIQGAYSDGGAVFCDGSRPTIANCILSDNNLLKPFSAMGASSGAGLACYNGANATISGCVIRDNVALKGAAIYCSDSDPAIVDCAITNHSPSYDGAVMITQGSEPTIRRCTFSLNAGDAGAMYLHDSDPDIRNCIFFANGALGGAGIVVYGSSNPIISGCTFSKNEASYYGGAIYNAGSSSPDVNNCILWDNTADISGDNYYGNWTITYSNVGGGASGTGNIDADPCFVDADANDFHLGPNSPCIEAGDPNGDYTGESDIDGQDRVMDGDADCNEVVDMGADEAYGPDCWNCGTQCYGDADCDSDVDLGDLSILNAAFGTEYGDPNYNACADFDKDGDINFGELFTLTTNFGPPDPNSDCDCGGTWPPQ